MRILFVDECFGLPRNSWRLRTYEFGRRLVKGGHSVTVICGNDTVRIDMKGERVRTIQAEGMEMLVVSSEAKGAQRFSRQACRVAFKDLKERPDVVVAVMAPMGNANAGLKISRKYKIPLVSDVRELYEVPSSGNGSQETGKIKSSARLKAGNIPDDKFSARLLKKIVYRNSAKIIAVSPVMISGILQYNSEVEKIEHIPHYADLKAFNPESDGKGDNDKSFLKKKGIKNDFVSVCLGGAVDNTGFEYFLGAAALHSASDMGWVVAGSGGALPDLKRQVKEAGLQEQVFFMEELSRGELIKLMSCVDSIMVLIRNASLSVNGLPEIYFNSLAAGRPLIVNVSEWATELLLKYNAGIVVPPGSFREIARSVGSLSKRPELVKVMGDNARILAVEKFDIEFLFKQYEGVLLEASRG